LRRELSSRTRVVAVSWVSFFDGYRHDLAALAEIAHAAGAWFCVDAIQGLGAFPMDADGARHRRALRGRREVAAWLCRA
jgi:cysteine desulfurase/selenocysteine lyase